MIGCEMGDGPAEYYKHMHQSKDLVSRQAMNTRILHETAFAQNCLTFGTRVLHLDLSSIVAPLKWVTDNLFEIVGNAQSPITQLELLIPASRLQAILPTLLNAANLNDINLWLCDDDIAAGEHLDGEVDRAVIDFETGETVISCGAIPHLPSKGGAISDGKIVSIAMDRSHSRLHLFFQWIVERWPLSSIENDEPGCQVNNAAMRHFSPFQRVTVSNYVDSPATGYPQYYDDSLEMYYDFVHRLAGWKALASMPLVDLHVYGLGPQWLNTIRDLASRADWLPDTELQFIVDCVCKRREFHGVPTCWSETSSNGEAWQAGRRKEAVTCEAIAARLEDLTVASSCRERIVVEHVVEGDDCFIGITFARAKRGKDKRGE